MITVLTAVHATNRAENVIQLHRQLKEKAGLPYQHLVVVDGNPKLYDLLKSEVRDLILLPENLEWVGAMNEGASRARYEYIMHIDEDCTIYTDEILLMMLSEHLRQWKDGQGILGFYDCKESSPRFLTTKSYAFKENMGNLMWPEYIHGGDAELYTKSAAKKQYYYAKNAIVVEKKIDDESRRRSLEVHQYDELLFKKRKDMKFQNILTRPSDLGIGMIMRDVPAVNHFITQRYGHW